MAEEVASEPPEAVDWEAAAHGEEAAQTALWEEIASEQAAQAALWEELREKLRSCAMFWEELIGFELMLCGAAIGSCASSRVAGTREH